MSARYNFPSPVMSLVLLVAAVTPAIGTAQRAPLLVSTEWLASHLGDPDVVVIQAGGRAPDAKTERIPGTHWVAYASFAVTTDGTSSELPSPDSLRSLFAAVGVSDDSHVILTGQPLSVTRAFYSLDYMGLPHVSVLNGGLTKWKREGRPVETSEPPVTRGQLSPRPPRADAVVTTDWVVEHLGKPRIALFDTRTEGEYIGAEGGNGHVQGARFIDFRRYFANQADFELADSSALARLFADRAAPGDTIVAYCAIGYRASSTYFVSRYLGLPVRLYDGSMDAWSQRKLPVVTAVTPLRTGEGMKNTGGALPAVSPEGRHIAFVAVRDGRQSDVYVVRDDGSGEQRLTRTPEWEERPSWIGNRVFVSVRAGDSVRASTVAPNGSQPKPIAAFPGREARPTPDGSRVLTVAGEPSPVLVVASGDGSNPHPVGGGPGIPPQNVAWSPDGRRLAYSTFDIQSTRTLQIGLMNADGTDAHFVTRLPSSDGRAYHPAWSPDGSRIAFHTEKEGATPSERFGFIYVVDIASGAVTKLTPHDSAYVDQTPAWFPDGKRIVYSSDRSGTMELWVMNADGTGGRQLTSLPAPRPSRPGVRR